MTARMAATALVSDVREAVHERGNHGRLGVADLEARAAMGAELGRCVSDRGQGAQHQEFPLSQGESASRVEVAEAELCQESRQ
jgi:hypothetical protein